MAQFERRLIQERTHAGLAAARARGLKGGRPKVDEVKIQTAKRMHADKNLSIKEICKVLKISKPTLYRYLGFADKLTV